MLKKDFFMLFEKTKLFVKTTLVKSQALFVKQPQITK